MDESSKAAQGGRGKVNSNLESCKTTRTVIILLQQIHAPYLILLSINHCRYSREGVELKMAAAIP